MFFVDLKLGKSWKVSQNRWCRSCLFCFPLLTKRGSTLQKLGKVPHASVLPMNINRIWSQTQIASHLYLFTPTSSYLSHAGKIHVESVEGNTWTMVVSKCHKSFMKQAREPGCFRIFTSQLTLSVYYVHQPKFLGESLLLGWKWSWDFSVMSPNKLLFEIIVFFGVFSKQISQKLLGQKPKNSYFRSEKLQVYSAAWSPFGDVILTACGDDRIRVFRPKVRFWVWSWERFIAALLDGLKGNPAKEILGCMKNPVNHRKRTTKVSTRCRISAISRITLPKFNMLQLNMF